MRTNNEARYARSTASLSQLLFAHPGGTTNIEPVREKSSARAGA